MANDNSGLQSYTQNPYYMAPNPVPQPVPQQPWYTQPQQAAPVPQQIPSKVVGFVQGEIGATIFNVMAGQTAYLFDMDAPDELLFKKSRDASGKLLPLIKLKLVPIEDKKEPAVDLKEYAKTNDILDLIVDTVRTEVDKRLSEISFTPSAKKGSDE
jgi:hypothetical protein